MKTFIMYLSMLLCALPASAQEGLVINSTVISTPKGDQPAFEFFVPGMNGKSVLEGWARFLNNYDSRPVQDRKQAILYFCDNALIGELSENRIDIYTRILDTADGVRFACAFDLGGVFISSRKTADKITRTKIVLYKFYTDLTSANLIVADEIAIGVE